MINDVMSQILKGAVNAYDELIKKLISFAGLRVETSSIEELTRIKEELSLRGYEIVSGDDQGTTMIHLIHNGEKVATGIIKTEMDYEKNSAKMTYKIINPNES